MVVAIVLERNPELDFSDPVDLDGLVKEAFNDFQKDRSRFEGIEKQVEYLPFSSGSQPELSSHTRLSVETYNLLQ